jgi:predicted transcriptional regulator
MSSVGKVEQDILRILKQRPISVSELARKLNVRRDFLAGYLESMRDRGKLSLISVGKAHVYQIKEGVR